MIPLIITSLLSPSQPPDITWEAVYDADVMPSDASPRWFSGPQPNTTAEVTEDGLAITDAGTEPGDLCFFTRNWSAEPGYGAVLEVRLRTVRCTKRAGCSVLVADGEHEDCLTFWPDRVDSHKSDLRVEMDTSSSFHTYRIAVGGEKLTLWIDGELAHEGDFTAEAHEGRNVVGFGSISSPAEGQGIWQSVRYALTRPPTTPAINAEHAVIYREDGIYACFPSLINYGDGKLGTSFGTRVRRSHIDGTGGSARMISEDSGATWAEVDSLPHHPQLTAADGSLVNAYARGWRESPAEKRAELEAAGFEVRKVREGTVAHCEGAYWMRSTDGGESWERGEIPYPKMALLMGFNNSARLTTSRGVRLVAVYGRDEPGGLRRGLVLRSADDGLTWKSHTLADPLDDLGFSETALCEAADGSILAMMRNEPSEGGYLHITRSTDDGLTWSAPVSIGIWGHPAHLLTLPDGRVLCTYGYRRAAMGVRACLSSDNGLTWDADNIIILRSDAIGNGGDLGYPLTTLLPDGRLFTIYYITLADQVTHIASTTWDIPR